MLRIKSVLYDYDSLVVWGQSINSPYVCYINDVRGRDGVQLFISPLHFPETTAGFTVVMRMLSLSRLDSVSSWGHFDISLWKRSGVS